MNTDNTGHSAPRGQALLRRASALAAAAAGTALLTTACGGSPTAGPASQQAAPPANQQAAATSIPPAQQAQLTQLAQQYTACMRSHGVTNFPEPSPGGGFEFELGGIDTHSSRYQAATQACQNIVSKAHKLMHSG
ncbi:MAG TPA: hypothetical protein VGM53_20985 [Streptosporangiaceae bacterium]